MAYRMGYCPCCDCQLQVKDCFGKWSSRTPAFAQADLVFESGPKVRTMICKDCLKDVDYQKLMDAITSDDSKACADKYKTKIKAMGLPVNIIEVRD